MKTTTAIVCFSLALCCAATSHAVTFDWATVGNPGNPGDPQPQVGPFGSVGYTYRISKHEVTNAQYTEFLNAVAVTDTNGLYHTQMGIAVWGGIVRSGSPGNYTYEVKSNAVGKGPVGTDYTYADKPLVYVTFFDSMRFVNWLENGQPSGVQDASTTEDGVYAISDGLSETRSTSARYAIPTRDEWHKAAYHKNDGVTANYWDYPTSTDLVPNNNLPTSDTGNSANFDNATSDFDYSLTDVGSYSLSESSYGTFDQGGNVWERVEDPFGTSGRVMLGGSWNFGSEFLLRTSRSGAAVNGINFNIGFRVVAVPEPSTLLLGAMSAVGLLMRRSREGR